MLAPRHALDRTPLATHLRGTVLASSLSAIEGLGMRDDYFATLAPEHHDAIRGLVVNDWIPMALALAHYGALETMGLAGEVARDNGRKVADRVQKSYLATLVRALGVGITPWSVWISPARALLCGSVYRRMKRMDGREDAERPGSVGARK